VARAQALGPLPRQRPEPRGDGADEAAELEDRLKEWRKQRGLEQGIDSSLVLNRHAMGRIARARPRSVEELAVVDGLVDWQFESFGAELVELVGRFEADLAAGRIELGRRRGKRRGPPQDAE
jgi:superfamily II DNA helicase RecQ